MWWGWTASRRVRRRSSVSLAYRVSWAAAPADLRLCADNLDAYTYESIIVGYFSLFVRY